MEQSVKLRLGLALLLAQLLLYYFAPKGSSKGDHNGGSTHVDFCRVSPAEKVCLTPIAALLNLCPLPKIHFAPRLRERKDDNSIDDDEGENERNVKKGDEVVDDENRDTFEKEGRKQEEKEEVRQFREDQDGEMPETEEKIQSTKEEKQSSLIYQIIVVLLVVSVTASLADCFHERSRRKANPDAVFTNNLRGEPTLNRRMSLADLTMQRHARRESQASFRPPGSKPDPEDFMGRRSSSQESPRTPSRQAPSRQKSCPAPFLRRLSTVDLQDLRDAQDGSWAEKRRVPNVPPKPAARICPISNKPNEWSIYGIRLVNWKLEGFDRP